MFVYHVHTVDVHMCIVYHVHTVDVHMCIYVLLLKYGGNKRSINQSICFKYHLEFKNIIFALVA